MSIPITIEEFLERRKIKYRVVSHSHSETSMRSAEAAHISGEQVAKGVLLKDGDGYLLAVLPATYSIQIGVLRETLERPVELAPEIDLGVVFSDCELGAVPALGAAYDVPVVVDSSFLALSEVYFEAGNHEDLIGVDGAAFEDLLGDARHLHFGVHKA